MKTSLRLVAAVSLISIPALTAPAPEPQYSINGPLGSFSIGKDGSISSSTKGQGNAVDVSSTLGSCRVEVGKLNCVPAAPPQQLPNREPAQPAAPPPPKGQAPPKNKGGSQPWNSNQPWNNQGGKSQPKQPWNGQQNGNTPWSNGQPNNAPWSNPQPSGQNLPWGNPQNNQPRPTSAPKPPSNQPGRGWGQPAPPQPQQPPPLQTIYITAGAPAPTQAPRPDQTQTIYFTVGSS